MIITKTPYRISFFGGGSDYPSWFNKFGGKVLSTTIDKNIYISCRFLPSFFKHKFRIVWSKIENVQYVNQIQHTAVRTLLKHIKLNQGVEIHYDGDLPARSGMGSSSCFTVGLMKALLEIKKQYISKYNLAKKAIYFEQKIMKEVVGSQDQIASSLGGFNKIIFKKKNFFVKKLKKNRNIKKLEENLILIYTGIPRTAHKIASGYVDQLTSKKRKYIEEIIKHVDIAERILHDGEIDDFGELLNESWNMKKKLSKTITSSKIDNLYTLAKKMEH